jgi:predicted acetyltransferase
MNSGKLQLRELRISDEKSFRAAIDEFGRFEPEWTFAFHFDESTDFVDYVKRLESWSEARDLPGGFVANTFLVGVVNNVIVGRLSFRHTLNPFLRRIGGHIGYGVIPSQRQRGYATEMLRQSLPIAKSREVHELLITCDADNIPSQRVIEKNGGVFEKTVENPESNVPVCHYWIDLRQ